MKNSRRILLGVLFATVALFFVAGTALAQDPVKLSPNNYKVLLENDQVRVLEFRAKPGEKEPMHSHPAYVRYALSGGKTKFSYPDGKTEEREIKAGTASWSEAVTHSGENVGTTEVHTVLIELKGAATPAKK
jgi:beta-alanine degradation protein BauB